MLRCIDHSLREDNPHVFQSNQSKCMDRFCVDRSVPSQNSVFRLNILTEARTCGVGVCRRRRRSPAGGGEMKICASGEVVLVNPACGEVMKIACGEMIVLYPLGRECEACPLTSLPLSSVPYDVFAVCLAKTFCFESFLFHAAYVRPSVSANRSRERASKMMTFASARLAKVVRRAEVQHRDHRPSGVHQKSWWSSTEVNPFVARPPCLLVRCHVSCCCQDKHLQ